MRSTILLAAIVALSATAGASPAHAEAGAVLVVGKASAKQRATVASAVRSAARSGGWELTETPLSDAEVATIVGCLRSPDVWSCVSPIAAPKAIQRLIVVRVDPDLAAEESSTLVLTEQILLAGTAVPTADQRPCARCIDETLTRVTFDLTRGLTDEALAGTARTKITIRSSPPGAWITLDTNTVGLTDHTYTTFPGRHLVIVRRDGYETDSRKVDVTENQETVVAFDLQPKGKGKPSSGPTEHPYLKPGIVAGAGLLAIAAGVIVQVTKDPPDTDVQPKYIPSTLGIALMAGGSITTAVGVYLWLRVSKQSRAPASAPTAAITNGGGIIGWSGSF
jgi:hypothetical protein